MKRKTKAILVCLLAAIATATVMSPAAFAAEVRPHWLIEKVELAEGKEEAAKAKGSEITYEFSGIKVVCKKIEITNALLLGASQQRATITPSVCSVPSLPACEVVAGGGHFREVIVFGPHKEEKHYEIWVGEGETEPFQKETFATVTVKGAGCVVAGKYEIKGSVIAEFEPNKPKEEVKVAKMKFKGKEGLKEEFEDPFNGKVELAGGLKTGETEVFLKGEFEEELTSGKKFGAT